MTDMIYSHKIKLEHLARKAIVYLRQSSERQVTYNKESQQLQYAMAERVRALGWTQVEIINSDLGSSAGITSAQREGFERVLSSVALGEVGIVGSRELSRLSRTDKDWCRLLEVCQIFGTLIADEQQIYDLNYLDDHQDQGPVVELLADDLRAEFVGGGLQRGDVVDGEEGVVGLAEADLRALQLLLDEAVPVEVVGGLERKERGDPHHHRAQGFVAEVEVVVREAAALAGEDAVILILCGVFGDV